MSRESELVVAVLYPQILGTYGDQGNAVVLQKRLEWRGIPGRLLTVDPGSPVPAEADVYVLGGGEDAAQAAALRELQRSSAFATRVAGGATVFAVCAGLQLLGASFELADGSVRPGADLLDITTTRLEHRAVGDVIADVVPELGLPPLLGFENHGGCTTLGPAARPLAHVQVGTGNSGTDGAEGALQDGIIATYLHGPVLAHNPQLADLVLSRALGRVLDETPNEALDTLRAERLGSLKTRAERSVQPRPWWRAAAR